MKKTISIVLCLILALSVILLFGCGKQNEEVPQDDSNLSGGWSVTTEFEAPAIPKDAQAAFDKATDELDGATYSAVAFLGSQVVAGSNYAFLCNVTSVTAEPKTEQKVVTVYADLDGNAEIKDVIDFDIVQYTEDKDIDFEQLSGGYAADDAIGGKLEANAQSAFDKALDGMTGVGYEPLAVLGTQVVAGTNYAVLCKATSVTAEPVSKLAVVVVYADLGGNAEITSICPFDF